MISDKRCPQCSASFHCGSQSNTCWCATLPAIMPVTETKSCLCPDCLAQAVGRAIESKLKELDHQQALVLAKTYAKSRHIIEHIDYTMEQDKLVFTPWYLLKKGKCCGKKCRNCPYE